MDIIQVTTAAKDEIYQYYLINEVLLHGDISCEEHRVDELEEDLVHDLDLRGQEGCCPADL